ncbi:expressed unknown protein [Seminavis robusta]|uniref:G-protein coupled receptors family 2 profile 2 domain-containing protein n=1 Tax=Seminavis robusta TaxID=568900 RepID=A0A9N8HKM1_9STRA|nr:expressed unknown protein [Seminavis robusta]|eukprot:Sro765_g199220.1 n/a (826) ;mRNA; f:32205-34682
MPPLPPLLLHLLLVLLSPQLLLAQRLNYCFDDEESPVSCEPTEESESFDPEITVEQNAIHRLCTELIADYVGGDQEAAMDVDIYPDLLANIPADSELCNRVRRYFPHCQWCQETSCGFGPDDEAPLTCDPNATLDYENEEGVWIFSPEDQDANVEDNSICSIFNDILSSAAVTNLSAHAEKLAEFGGLPEECRHFRRKYPRCYFCSPNTQEGENYCSWDALCEKAKTLRDNNETLPITVDDNTTIQQTCQDIGFVVKEGLRQISTTDLCDRAPLALATACPQHCEPCFDPAQPLSCQDEEETQPPTTISTEDSFLEELEDILDSQFDISVTLCVFLSYNIQSTGTDILDVPEHMRALESVRASSPFCPHYRAVYPRCFFCRDDDENDWDCSNDEDHPVCQLEPPQEVYTGDNPEQFRAACQQLQEVFLEDLFPSTRELCAQSQQFSRYCPCGEIEEEFSYLGADTNAKKQTLVWMPRISAALSFFGASYILWIVLSNRSNRGFVYFQLLACMAAFDLMTAVSWAFSTLPIDNHNIAGAKGTEATCTAQGFFIQLGLTSVFLNVTLALYYWLVIVRNVRESRLRVIRPMLFAPPLILGFGLAFAGIPFFQGLDYACHIKPVPHGDLWQVLLFVAIPIGASILSISVTMIGLYWKVREQSQATRRWRFGGSAKLEKRVFWQALFYTMSFYITWPVVLCVYVTGVDESTENFGFSVLVAFVAPLQGFNNWLVFIRPKVKSPIDPSSLRSTSKYISRFFGAGSTGDLQPQSRDLSEEVVAIRPVARMVDPSVVVAQEARDLSNIRTETAVEDTPAVPGAVEEEKQESAD